MNRLIIGVEVYLSLSHILARKHIFYNRYDIANHFALRGLFTHINQKDKGFLRRNGIVDSK